MTTANILLPSLRILEDDVQIHDYLIDLLRSNKINVADEDITHDTELFISKVSSHDINICVIDHLLPGGTSGLDVCHKVREINKWTYVIIMTGQTDYKVVVQYMKCKIDDYVDKNEKDYEQLLVKAIRVGFETVAERIRMLRAAEETKNILNL